SRRPQRGGLVRHGDGVEIGQEEQALAARLPRTRDAILHSRPIADGAEIIAEMEGAGGLDTGTAAHADGLNSKTDPECPMPGRRSESGAARPSPDWKIGARPAARGEARALTQKRGDRIHRGAHIT